MQVVKMSCGTRETALFSQASRPSVCGQQTTPGLSPLRTTKMTREIRDDLVYLIMPSEILLTAVYTQLLAQKIKALGLSRQGLIDWLDQKIFHELDAPVYLHRGEKFIIYPGIYEDAFFGSMDYRWGTDIKFFSDRMPQRAPNKRLELRYQLFDLAFKVNGNPIKLNK